MWPNSSRYAKYVTEGSLETRRPVPEHGPRKEGKPKLASQEQAYVIGLRASRFGPGSPASFAATTSGTATVSCPPAAVFGTGMSSRHCTYETFLLPIQGQGPNAKPASERQEESPPDAFPHFLTRPPRISKLLHRRGLRLNCRSVHGR